MFGQHSTEETLMTQEQIRAGYDPAAAQERWQKFWEADQTFVPVDD